MDRLDADHPHAPVVLTGTGATFSAGLDLTYTFPIFASGDAEAIGGWWQRYRETNMRLFTAARPMVAAVNGHAIAGGLITALACDYRIGPEPGPGPNARFALNEVPIGIAMPSVYIEMIRSAVGDRATNLWTLFGRFHDARQALADGYLDELVDPDAVLGRAIEVAHEVSADAVEAFVRSKRVLRAPTLRRIETLGAELDRGGPPGARSVAANATALAALKGSAAAADPSTQGQGQ